MSRPLLHALSFDVEEYFHVANLAHQFPAESWDGIESRLDVGMDLVLKTLAKHDSHATFFFLGWVAQRRPDLVRRCHEEGHEVASHGFDHRFLWDVGPEGLDEHLGQTENAIVNAGVPKPVGFRASTFTLTHETRWAFEILARRGYRYDSSVHPVHHPLYGIPDFNPGISQVDTPAGALIEFPVATLPFCGRNLPVGGGGYFRLLPGAIHRWAVGRLEASRRPAALYLHPWEFDPQQPRVPAPALKRWRHYLNLDRSLARLEQLLSRFQFGSMAAVLDSHPIGTHPRLNHERQTQSLESSESEPDCG